jgi:hypothetical protein
VRDGVGVFSTALLAALVIADVRCARAPGAPPPPLPIEDASADRDVVATDRGRVRGSRQGEL